MLTNCAKTVALTLILSILFAWSGRAQDGDSDNLVDAEDPRPNVVDLPVVAANTLSARVGIDLKIKESSNITQETSFEQTEIDEFKNTYTKTYSESETSSFSKSSSVGWDSAKITSSLLGFTGGFNFSGKNENVSTHAIKNEFQNMHKETTENIEKFKSIDNISVDYDGSSGYLGLDVEFENLSPYPVTITEFHYSIAVVEPNTGKREILAERVPLNSVIIVGGKLLATSGPATSVASPLKIELPARGPTAIPINFRFEIDGLKTDRIQAAVSLLKIGGYVEATINRYVVKWSPNESHLDQLVNSDEIRATLYALQRKSVRVTRTGENGRIETDLVQFQAGEEEKYYLNQLEIPFTYDNPVDKSSFGPSFLGSVYGQVTVNNLTDVDADETSAAAWVVYRQRGEALTLFDGFPLEAGDTLFILKESSRAVRKNIFKYKLLDGISMSTRVEWPEGTDVLFEQSAFSLSAVRVSRRDRWFADVISPRISSVLSRLNSTDKNASASMPWASPVDDLDLLTPDAVWQHNSFFNVPYGDQKCIPIAENDFTSGDVVEIPILAHVETFKRSIRELAIEEVIDLYKLDSTHLSYKLAFDTKKRFRPTEYNREPYIGTWSPGVPSTLLVPISLSINGGSPTLIQNLLNVGSVLLIPWTGDEAYLNDNQKYRVVLLQLGAQLSQSLAGGGTVCLSIDPFAKFKFFLGRWIAELQHVVTKAPGVFPPGVPVKGTIASGPSGGDPFWQDVAANLPILKWHSEDIATLVDWDVNATVLFAVGIRQYMYGRRIEWP